MLGVVLGGEWEAGERCLLVDIDFVHTTLGFFLRDDLAGVLYNDPVGGEGAGGTQAIATVIGLWQWLMRGMDVRGNRRTYFDDLDALGELCPGPYTLL